MAERSAKQLGLSKADLPNSITEVIATLNKGGFEAYIVGGGVRDTLLGLNPKDFDAVTDAKPHEIKDIFGKRCRIIGRRFQLAHVYSGRDMIEVATFRAPPEGDSHTTGEGMIVRDNVWGDINQDFARRDFSINAMYYQPLEGVVYDFCNALDDMKNKTLRLLGRAALRIEEDPVRLLRALRFKAKLSFDFDEDLAEQFHNDNWALLEQVSPHRLYDESQKMFTGGYLVPLLPLLFEYGAMDHLFAYPPKAATTLVTQVAVNTDKRIAMGKSINPAFFYAALLWDNYLFHLNKYKNKGMPFYEAQQKASIQVVSRQRLKTAIPKFAEQFIRDIWLMQPKLANPRVKQIMQLAEHPRFRAAFDFLLLREQGDDTANPLSESTNGMGEWWQTYQTLSDSQQQQAIDDFSDDSRRGKNKRNRSRNRHSIVSDTKTADTNDSADNGNQDGNHPPVQRPHHQANDVQSQPSKKPDSKHIAAADNTFAVASKPDMRNDDVPIPAKRSRRKSNGQPSLSGSDDQQRTSSVENPDKTETSTKQQSLSESSRQKNSTKSNKDSGAKRNRRDDAKNSTESDRQATQLEQNRSKRVENMRIDYRAERKQLQLLSLDSKASARKAARPAPLFTISADKLAKQVPNQAAVDAKDSLTENKQSVKAKPKPVVEPSSGQKILVETQKEPSAQQDRQQESQSKDIAKKASGYPQQPTKPDAMGLFPAAERVPYKRVRRQPSSDLTQTEQLQNLSMSSSDDSLDVNAPVEDSASSVTQSKSNEKKQVNKTTESVESQSKETLTAKSTVYEPRPSKAKASTTGNSAKVADQSVPNNDKVTEPAATPTTKRGRVPATRRRRQPSSALSVNERS